VAGSSNGVTTSIARWMKRVAGWGRIPIAAPATVVVANAATMAALPARPIAATRMRIAAAGDRLERRRV
jgi:hypothetical protein